MDNEQTNISNHSEREHERLFKSFDELTLKDAKDIFRELQESQIELLKENEKLLNKQIEFQKAKDEYLSLITNSYIALINLGQKAEIIEINDQAAALLGLPIQQLKGSNILNFIIEEDINLFELNLDLVFKTEEKQQLSVRIINQNHEINWIQVKMVLVKNHSGFKTCNLIIKGKSDRKRTEQALKDTVLQWQKIFDGISDFVCLFDREGRIIQANNTTCKLLGKKRSEIIGSFCYEVFHNSQEPIENCPFNKVKETGKREILCVEYNNRWMEVIVDPLFDENKMVVGCVHIMSDVSERHKIEELLKESEEKFKTIFEEAHDGIIITDAESHKVISANKMASSLLGYDFGKEHNVKMTDIFSDLALQKAGKPKNEKNQQDNKSSFSVETKKSNGEIFYSDINSSYLKIKGKKYLLSIFRDITNRFEIEKELKDAKERFELIFNTSPDAILITRVHDGYYIDSNETFTNYTGYTREDLTGKTTLDINIWNNPNDREKLMKELQLKGHCQNLEVVVKNKDGSLRTIIMSAEIIQLYGSPHLLSISRDITDRKKMESMFSESQEKYKLIADNANDVITVFHLPNHKFSYVSPAIKNFTGFSVDEFLQIKFSKIISTVDLRSIYSDILKRIRAIRNSGDKTAFSKNYEFQLIKKNSSRLWVELSTTLKQNFNGEIEEMIGVSRNIQKRKTIEQAVIQTEKRQNILLKINQTPFESNDELLKFCLRESIILTGSKSGFLFIINEARKEIIKVYWSDDVMEKCRIEIPKTPLKIEKGILCNEAVKQKKPVIVNDISTSHLPIYIPEGHIEISNFISVPVIIDKSVKAVIGLANKPEDYDNNDIMHLSLLMDGAWKVMNRNELESLLKIKNEELLDLVATKDRFFSIIAHDLKNPFNVIIGFSELILNSKGANNIENLKKYAGYIHHSSKQAFNLLTNLLEWTNSKRGMMNFQPVEIDVKPFVSDTYNILENNFNEKNIVFHQFIPENLLVDADRNMLGIIIRNLLSNAIKYTHIGGNISIKIEESNGNDVLFAIIDDGTGIKEDDIAKLFRNEILFTTSGTNNEKGTGLGLLLCKDFVDKHKGKIWVESEFGKGSTFYFTIPKHQI